MENENTSKSSPDCLLAQVLKSDGVKCFRNAHSPINKGYEVFFKLKMKIPKSVNGFGKKTNRQAHFERADLSTGRLFSDFYLGFAGKPLFTGLSAIF